MSGTIWTAGHSTLPIEDFTAMLTEAGIRMLVDIRSYPGSKYCPQFGQRVLPESLSRAGVSYMWLPPLGGRRKACRMTAWRNPSFGGYARWMTTPEFGSGLIALEGVARSQPTAIMCSERSHTDCHRRCVSSVLLARGWEVLHLQMDGVEEHRLPDFAVARDGMVSYPTRQLSLVGEAA